MKSPNHRTSMKNLNLAMDLIRNVYEDVKNDERVRRANIHNQLLKANEILEISLGDLDLLGYPPG